MNVILNIAKTVLFINYAVFFAICLLASYDGITYSEASWGLVIIGVISVLCIIPFEIQDQRSRRS
jgi:hypothetical protein